MHESLAERTDISMSEKCITFEEVHLKSFPGHEVEISVSVLIHRNYLLEFTFFFRNKIH